MHVDIRAVSKLTADTAPLVGAALSDVLGVLAADPAELARVRIVCDWLQYKNNFREVLTLRPLAFGAADETLELAIDLRRGANTDIVAATKEALAGHAVQASPRIALEGWGPGSASCIWAFNALYWQALELWERATGQAYESALPGGESDARNQAAVRDLIGELFQGWDALTARSALPDELYVVELGVGNGNQAKAFLDMFKVMDVELGRDYYRRLHYLLCDYSPYVLELARQTVAVHADKCSSVSLDATTPTIALGFLRFKVFLAYISNVYDNLPCDEVAQLGGHTYLVETRAYVPEADAEEIAHGIGIQAGELAALIHKLLRLGPTLLAETMPEQFPEVDDAVTFWRRCWDALKLAERYAPLSGVDGYEIAPKLSGELLRPQLESRGEIRMNVSNGAAASFAGTLPLLHPYGRIVCHDLFVTETPQHQTAFRGPGKYAGSVVNWVNGPLLAHIGSRRGFDVRYDPFAHRAGTNVVTMTAQVRD